MRCPKSRSYRSVRPAHGQGWRGKPYPDGKRSRPGRWTCRRRRPRRLRHGARARPQRRPRQRPPIPLSRPCTAENELEIPFPPGPLRSTMRRYMRFLRGRTHWARRNAMRRPACADSSQNRPVRWRACGAWRKQPQDVLGQARVPYCCENGCSRPLYLCPAR